MTTAIPPDATRFRIKIVSTAIFIFTGGLTLGVIGFVALVMAKHGAHINWQVLLKSIFSVIPILAMLALLSAAAMSLLLPAYISSIGIHGHSLWGVRCFINWSDIKSAKKLTLGNLTYLRLYSSKGGPTLALPLFQKPQVPFVNEIRRLAPAGNPILEHVS